ncbi:hypothetical protein AAF712_009093 [Marasmius tenuissimus]|uniref:DUF6534 domain-containing protein n=1 Tax=Marasmius tenuissimus TaxID=585030 RepID=A0ABR2ZRX9_9AGAR
MASLSLATPSSLPSTDMGTSPGSGLGPIFIGTLILFGLFGLLSVQMYIYHLAHTADRRAIRTLIYGVYILLTVQVVMCGQDGFKRFASTSPSPVNGINLGWFFIPIIGGLVGLGVQTFYACGMTHVPTLSALGLTPYVQLSVLSVAAAFASGILGTRAKSLEKVGSTEELRISYAIWYTTSAACDVIIAVYMCYLLTRGSSNGVTSTKRIIARIIRLTVETNALTAAVAVTTVGLLVGQNNQTYNTPFALVLPSIYGNTLMIMLNLRLKISSTNASNNIVSTTISNASFGPNPSSQACTHCHELTAQPRRAHVMVSPVASHHDQFPATKNVQSDALDYPIQFSAE